jgi:hypothetical protein
MSDTKLHKLYRKWIRADRPKPIPHILQMWFNRKNGHRGDGKAERKALIEKIAKKEIKNQIE